MKYKVYYTGWYVVEAENIEEAMESEREEGIYEAWENDKAILWEEDDDCKRKSHFCPNCGARMDGE